MKRILPVLFLLASGLGLFANPLPSPSIEFSELCFDNQGEWTVELSYRYIYPGAEISKIVLSSSTDSVVISGFTFDGPEGVFVFRKDSLSTPFHINQKGDSLTLKYYWNEYPLYPDVLVFGDYRGAQISSPRAGQSICKWFSYVKDKSPSIGALNDTTGIYGTLKGLVYDKYSVSVANRRFQFGYTLITTGNGSYSTRVLSQAQTYTTIWYSIGENTWKSVKIDTVHFEMEPDSVIIRDIHLLGDLGAGIDDLPENNVFRLYPNPVNKGEKLHYEIDLPLKTADCRLEILNVDGKLLSVKVLSEANGEIEMPFVRGFVIVNLWMDNKVVSTHRVLVNHE